MATLGSRPLVNLLRALWVLVIIWLEYGSLFNPCDWPDSRVYDVNVSRKPVPPKISHVLVVADPHVLHTRSYPNSFALFALLNRLIVHLNLSKNWHIALKKNPDAIVFLGDMMDYGRDDIDNDEYEAYYNRFQSIFRADRDVPRYYVPGNKDVGLGNYPYLSPQARTRYIAHFGAPNYDVVISNHTLVLFDAPAYADEDAMRHGLRLDFYQWKANIGGSVEYMLKFARSNHSEPVIFFTHIPLYRSDGKKCGPLREQGSLRPGVGLGWQNTLEKRASLRLLQSFKPAAIFSGDNHDYCEYMHHLPSEQSSPTPITVPEITVKAFSMGPTIRKPGFHLLSLAPADLWTDSKPTFSDTPCFLFDQERIYTHYYLPFLITSIVLLVVSNVPRGVRHRPAPQRRADDDAPDFALLTLESGNRSGVHLDDLSDDERGSSGLSTPASSSETSIDELKRSARSGGGWRQVADNPSLMSSITSVFQGLRLSASQPTSRRKRWLFASLRDMRDVLVFPLVTLLVTWWLIA